MTITIPKNQDNHDDDETRTNNSNHDTSAVEQKIFECLEKTKELLRPVVTDFEQSQNNLFRSTSLANKATNSYSNFNVRSTSSSNNGNADCLKNLNDFLDESKFNNLIDTIKSNRRKLIQLKSEYCSIIDSRENESDLPFLKQPNHDTKVNSSSNENIIEKSFSSQEQQRQQEFIIPALKAFSTTFNSQSLYSTLSHASSISNSLYYDDNNERWKQQSNSSDTTAVKDETHVMDDPLCVFGKTINYPIASYSLSSTSALPPISSSNITYDNTNCTTRGIKRPSSDVRSSGVDDEVTDDTTFFKKNTMKSTTASSCNLVKSKGEMKMGPTDGNTVDNSHNSKEKEEQERRLLQRLEKEVKQWPSRNRPAKFSMNGSVLQEMRLFHSTNKFQHTPIKQSKKVLCSLCSNPTKGKRETSFHCSTCKVPLCFKKKLPQCTLSCFEIWHTLHDLRGEAKIRQQMVRDIYNWEKNNNVTKKKKVGSCATNMKVAAPTTSSVSSCKQTVASAAASMPISHHQVTANNSRTTAATLVSSVAAAVPPNAAASSTAVNNAGVATSSSNRSNSPYDTYAISASCSSSNANGGIIEDNIGANSCNDYSSSDDIWFDYLLQEEQQDQKLSTKEDMQSVPLLNTDESEQLLEILEQQEEKCAEAA